MSDFFKKTAITDEDDDVVLIPEEDRTEEEEERVLYYMATYEDVLKDIGMEPFEKNTTKFTRVKIPDFNGDDRKKRIWEEEEIKRCISGYRGMSGKMYFYFNFSYMVNLTKGRFVPDYRVCDNEWFKLLTKVKDEGGWGIVCVKRRRVGASWKEAADALHDALFNPFYIVGMNSKGKEDSRLLFVKVNFIFDNLPSFLKVKVGGRTKDQIDFYSESHDELGNKVKEGNQSYIVVKAPTVSAFEGHMLNKWIIDEAGKQESLEQMFSFTEDAMMENTVRVGIPIAFGTSGEIGNVGKGLKGMWDNAEIYRLHKWFFSGYHGLMVDEFGNDMIEETIRWIVYERKRRKGLSTKSYYDFLQKYPLTIEEAFAQSSEGGLGDIAKIMKQLDAITVNPPKATKGKFKVNSKKEIVFIPSDLGEVTIYEHAKKGMQDTYLFGADPADHDKDDRTKLSELSTYAIKKAHGLEPPRIVAEYTARPKMLSDYYEQVIMMLQYYNDSKVLIENNRNRMIAYFDERGFKKLLHYSPQGIVKLVGGVSHAIGIKMTEAMKDYLIDLCVEYVDDHCEWIPDKALLKQFLKFGTKDKDDRVIAFGLALMLLKEDKTISRKKGATDHRLPSHGYSMDNRGNIKHIKRI